MARATDRRCAPMCSAARAEHGIDLTGGRVLLLCYPRLLGYTFNPLSVYFCYRADGELALMIYEVRNTFGDIHPYVLPVQTGPAQRSRRPAAAGQAVLRLALHRDGDALSFPRLAAGSARQAADPGNRRRRPPARRNFQWPPPRPEHAHSCCARSSRSRWSPSRSWRRSTGRRCGSGSRARGWCRVRTPPPRPACRLGKQSTIILRRRYPPRGKQCALVQYHV